MAVNLNPNLSATYRCKERAYKMPEGVQATANNGLDATPLGMKLLFWGCYNNSGMSCYKPFEGDAKTLNRWVMRNHTTLPYGVVEAGLRDIPKQVNGWSCGINSSARFLAMLGKPLQDYRQYHNQAPKHHLGHKETGPGTRWLTGWMTRDGRAEGLGVYSHMTHDWASQKAAIDISLAAGRPVMVLLEVENRMLHWVTLIGREGDSYGDYLAIDTDTRFSTIHGGEEGLRRRMNLDDHMIHNIPMRDDRIACFNSIHAGYGPLHDSGKGLVRKRYTEEGLAQKANEFGNVIDSVGELSGNAIDAVADAAKFVGNNVEDAAKAVGNGLEDSAKAIGNSVEGAAKAVWRAFGGLF